MFKKKKISRSLAKDDISRIISDKTPFAISESFRALQTNVLYLPIADKCRKIAVTSSVASEGKTYVSINLAITLASNSNKKVLLLDMDMRMTRVKALLQYRMPEAKNANGLSEYLVGIDNEPNIMTSHIENLDILFSGKKNSNPVGLINSEKMATLFETLSEKYDYIIIDTPPVNMVTDALLILDKVNGYILSARANYSTINSLVSATNTIKNVGGEIFGVVLTSVASQKIGSYDKVYPNGEYI